MSDLLTIDEVAARIRRSPATIRWWIHVGAELGPTFAKFGRRRMARKSDVDAWVDSHFDGCAVTDIEPRETEDEAALRRGRPSPVGWRDDH